MIFSVRRTKANALLRSALAKDLWPGSFAPVSHSPDFHSPLIASSHRTATFQPGVHKRNPEDHTAAIDCKAVSLPEASSRPFNTTKNSRNILGLRFLLFGQIQNTPQSLRAATIQSNTPSPRLLFLPLLSSSSNCRFPVWQERAIWPSVSPAY